MRSAFVVLAKLLGLMHLAGAMLGLPQLAAYFFPLPAPYGDAIRERATVALVGSAISLIIAFVLVTRTEWLASRLVRPRPIRP